MLTPLALAVAALLNDATWQADGEESDGIKVERRELSGFAFDELRVTASARRSVAALSLAAFELRKDGVQVRYLEERHVLSEGPEKRMVYLRVHPPFIGARECVMQQSRVIDEAAGTAQVAYEAVDVKAETQYRRFAKLRGSWRFEPDPKGGTRIVFVMISDVGGLPRWLARLGNGQQRDAAVNAVREVIDRASVLEARL